MASNSERVTYGPEFPGLDLFTEPGATGGAREAMNTRRDGGRLRGMPKPGDETPITGRPRGLHHHVRADGSVIYLAASGTPIMAIFSDDGMDEDARTDATRPLFWDGTPVNLTGTGYVVFAQEGPRSYICESGLGDV